jgi:hypothetical protein
MKSNQNNYRQLQYQYFKEYLEDYAVVQTQQILVEVVQNQVSEQKIDRRITNNKLQRK